MYRSQKQKWRVKSACRCKKRALHGVCSMHCSHTCTCMYIRSYYVVHIRVQVFFFLSSPMRWKQRQRQRPRDLLFLVLLLHFPLVKVWHSIKLSRAKQERKWKPLRSDHEALAVGNVGLSLYITFVMGHFFLPSSPHVSSSISRCKRGGKAFIPVRVMGDRWQVIDDRWYVGIEAYPDRCGHWLRLFTQLIKVDRLRGYPLSTVVHRVHD